MFTNSSSGSGRPRIWYTLTPNNPAMLNTSTPFGVASPSSQSKTVAGGYPSNEQKPKKSSSPGWERTQRLYCRLNQSANFDIGGTKLKRVMNGSFIEYTHQYYTQFTLLKLNYSVVNQTAQPAGGSSVGTVDFTSPKLPAIAIR